MNSHTPIVQLFSFAERPEFRTALDALSARSWPDFLDGDLATQHHWDELFEPALAPFQFLAIGRGADSEDILLGASHSIPFAWPGLDEDTLPDGGWDHVIETGIAAARTGTRVNALSALAVMVDPDHRQSTVAETLIANMKTTARHHGLDALVVPLRPTRKKDYPLAPFSDYVGWTSASGEPFDPWIRKHCRLGGRMVKVAPRSMRVSAPAGQWEAWTGLRFPVPGPYHVPGALVPVHFDENGIGTYVEPNLWVRHML